MRDEGLRLMKMVEERRCTLGLTQLEVALACGMTQGHFSKLTSGHGEVGTKCFSALEGWLELATVGNRTPHPLTDGSAQRLAASIRRDIGRLSAMIRIDGSGAPALRVARENGEN